MENIKEKKIIWYEGENDYKLHTLVLNENKKHEYTLELLDVPVPNVQRKFHTIIADILNKRQTKKVEILYSGGLDSEMILKACLLEKIPVKAITMRLILDGYAINTHDLYYSEKYCRQNNIEQQIIDLDVDNFFNNGLFIEYLNPYYVTMPHVATHFWLIEQCSSFPVISGDYSWPWPHKPIISPHKYSYAVYNKFLNDKGIDGIGNILNYSLELNLLLIKTHLEIVKENKIETNQRFIPIFKRELISRLGLGEHEIRLRSYGWEIIPSQLFQIGLYRTKLVPKFGTVKNIIKWNNEISKLIGGEPGINDKFYEIFPGNTH